MAELPVPARTVAQLLRGPKGEAVPPFTTATLAEMVRLLHAACHPAPWPRRRRGSGGGGRELAAHESPSDQSSKNPRHQFGHNTWVSS
jgi:hypothetical protein